MSCDALPQTELQVIANAPYHDYLVALERKFLLPNRLLSATEYQESRGQVDSISPKGAIGPFQFMPITAKRFSINPRDPIQAAHGAAQYLCLNLQMFNSLPLALAAYNAGEGTVIAYGYKIPPYPETQNYVASIMSRLNITMETPKPVELISRINHMEFEL